MSAPVRVLIVDDDAEIRDYLALALDGAGCAVTVAGDPAEVDDDLPYDVALVDLLLADGQTAEPLVGRLTGAGIDVVVMTGLSTDAAPVRRVRLVGARSILQKPFTLSAVRHAVLGA